MDHRTLVKSLTPQQRQQLTAKSDIKGFRQLALHLGLIGLFGALIAVRVPFWPLLLLPQGILIVFLFTALHETVHRTAFKSRWLNDSVAWLCGLLIVLPPGWFRYFHFAHHRFTQDPENDPELATLPPTTHRQYWFYLTGLPTWWGHLKTLVVNASGSNVDAFVPSIGRCMVTREARIMLAVYAGLLLISLLLQSAVLLILWVLPGLLGQPFLRLYLMAEHGRCPFVANMLENSRTTFTNGLVRRLAWNMPYHAEHHSYPGVPFHQLAAFHRFTASHLRETEDGYAAFSRKYIEGLN